MGVKVESVAPVNPTEAADNSKQLRIFLALAAVYIIWGSTYLGMRFALESFPPFLMTGVRFGSAGILLFIIQLVRGDSVPTRKQMFNASIIGALMLGVGTGGVAFAEQWVASGLAALAVAAVPIWAALFAGLWGRFPNRYEWIGLALGLSGVALLNMENGMQANPLGAIALLIGPISWSFASIWSQHLEMPKGLMTPAVEMMGGGIFLSIVGLLVREEMRGEVTTSAVLAFVYLVLAALVAFNAYTYLLQTVRPTLATSYAYVNPVVAVILGAVFAGEVITVLGVAAMIIILAGVGLLAFSRERQKS